MRWPLDWHRSLLRFRKVNLDDSSKNVFHSVLRQFLARHKNCGDEIRTGPHKFVRGQTLRPLLSTRPNCQEFALWIYQECRCTRFLRAVGVRLLDQYNHTDRRSHENLISQITNLADSHYRLIWSDLTQKERLVLYQLALDGSANPHPDNERAIEGLERKELIRETGDVSSDE